MSFAVEPTIWKPSPPELPVRVYLLGVLDFETLLFFQNRIADEVAQGNSPALICCEHPPLITVGRSGSHAHLDLDSGNRAHRGWPVRWVNRGGGCWFHASGQLAIYPVLPLRKMKLSVRQYVSCLESCFVQLLKEFGVAARGAGANVFVGSRPIACVGAAVRDWTTYYGAVLNVHPDLLPYRFVRTGRGHLPMTSLQRECRRPFRIGHVRERLIEHFVAQFHFADTLFFSGHPSLSRKARIDAVPAAG